MPTRRLDDRIRELCARAIAASEKDQVPQAEFESILQDLLNAIHEKVDRLRNLATRKLLRTDGRHDDPPTERRSSRP